MKSHHDISILRFDNSQLKNIFLSNANSCLQNVLDFLPRIFSTTVDRLIFKANKSVDKLKQIPCTFEQYIHFKRNLQYIVNRTYKFDELVGEIDLLIMMIKQNSIEFTSEMIDKPEVVQAAMKELDNYLGRAQKTSEADRARFAKEFLKKLEKNNKKVQKI